MHIVPARYLSTLSRETVSPHHSPMAAYADSIMSDELPLDPHGEEHIYDVAHSFLYRGEEATSALWHAPQPHADDVAPPAAAAAHRSDNLPGIGSSIDGVDADGQLRSMVNLATISEHGMTVVHAPEGTAAGGRSHSEPPVFGIPPHSSQEVPPQFDVVEYSALTPSTSDTPAAPGNDPHLHLAAWNQDSDDAAGGAGGGAGYGAALASSSDEEWQVAAELQGSDGDDDDEDDADEDGAMEAWGDDDEDGEEDEEAQESGGGGGYNTRTLVGSLLSRVGLHRLLASQQARRSHARCADTLISTTLHAATLSNRSPICITRGAVPVRYSHAQLTGRDYFHAESACTHTQASARQHCSAAAPFGAAQALGGASRWHRATSRPGLREPVMQYVEMRDYITATTCAMRAVPLHTLLCAACTSMHMWRYIAGRLCWRTQAIVAALRSRVLRAAVAPP